MSSYPQQSPSAAYPPLSSNSSRQSLRGQLQPQRPLPSRPRMINRNLSTQTQRPISSVNIDEPSLEASEPTRDHDLGHSVHSEDALKQPPESSQPRFQPFFTLVEDATTSEVFHPAVHYIFSDDDTEIVTEAVLRALETEYDNSAFRRRGGTAGHDDGTSPQKDDGEGGIEDGFRSSQKSPSMLPPPVPGERDHYIILDMEQTPVYGDSSDAGGPSSAPTAGGPRAARSVSTSPATQPQQQQQQTRRPSQAQRFRMASAHSLSPAWQVLNTQIVPAPTFDNNNNDHHQSSPNNDPHDDKASSAGLMLKIHGTGGLSSKEKDKDSGKERDKENGGAGSHRLEDMMDEFAKRMLELRRVMEAGERLQPSPSEKETTQGVEPTDQPVTGVLDLNQDLVDDQISGIRAREEP